MSIAPVLHTIDNSKNYHPTIIHLPLTAFTSKYESSPLILLQIPPSLPLSSLSSSYIIGTSSKPATLISENSGESYTLSRVETSNSFVLVPPSTDTTQMHAHLLGSPNVETSFLECQFHPLPRQCLLDTLKKYIHRESNGVTLRQLSHEVQCSEKQVLEGCRDIKALEITDGRFVLLKEEVSWDVRSAVVDSYVEMDWVGDKVFLDEVVKEANLRFDGSNNWELDERIVKHAMMDLGDVTDGNVVFETDKIAIYFAHRLLRERSPFPIDEFLKIWHTRMPGAHTTAPPLSLLAGIALIDDNSLSYYPAVELPLDASMRFQKLFKKREQWALDELDAYVKVLEKEGNVKELLLKYTRIVVDGKGGQWYKKR